MIDAPALFIIAGLFVVILAEFFFFQWLLDRESKEKKQLLDSIAQLNRALISKNANEYVMTTSIDKVTKDEQQQVENDLVDHESMSDDEFMKTIKGEGN